MIADHTKEIFLLDNQHPVFFVSFIITSMRSIYFRVVYLLPFTKFTSHIA